MHRRRRSPEQEGDSQLLQQQIPAEPPGVGVRDSPSSRWEPSGEGGCCQVARRSPAAALLGTALHPDAIWSTGSEPSTHFSLNRAGMKGQVHPSEQIQFGISCLICSGEKSARETRGRGRVGGLLCANALGTESRGKTPGTVSACRQLAR